MSEHTPGPWLARMQRRADGAPLGWIIERQEISYTERKRGRVIENRDRIGWSSYANAATNRGDEPPYEQSGANARLIAAAPDLLLAAQEALRQLGNLIGDAPYTVGMSTGPISEEDFRAVAALRDAIAKVEGREP